MIEPKNIIESGAFKGTDFALYVVKGYRKIMVAFMYSYGLIK